MGTTKGVIQSLYLNQLPSFTPLHVEEIYTTYELKAEKATKIQKLSNHNNKQSKLAIGVIEI